MGWLQKSILFGCWWYSSMKHLDVVVAVGDENEHSCGDIPMKGEVEGLQGSLDSNHHLGGLQDSRKGT